jgi:hypothetical protein
VSSAKDLLPYKQQTPALWHGLRGKGRCPQALSGVAAQAAIGKLFEKVAEPAKCHLSY